MVERAGAVGRTRPFWPGAAILALMTVFAAGANAAPDRPNVVIVIMDDVGFADLGSYGSEIETPTIDGLAENGLRYTNFTVTGVCSPSRAALLTGLNHHSAGVGHASDIPQEARGYLGEIHDDVTTLPEVLHAEGYATMMVGKWHLVNGVHRTAEGPYDEWPTGRGFDHYYGFLASHTSQWTPHDLWEGATPVEAPSDGTYYFPDAMTDRALEMLEEHRESSPNQPFFLYYSTPAAHAPHHTKPEDRAKYAGRFDRGYDVSRAERLARQQAIGLVPEDARLAPYYPGVIPFEELSDEQRLVSTRLQENYAAYLDNMDQNVGRVVAWLAEHGELENTILLVMSDNGGSREAYPNGTTNQGRFFSQFGETHEQRMSELSLVGGPDSYPNYPLGWMQASNTPFKLSKASVHGGGVRSPLIVHWPAGGVENGGLRKQLHHVNDVAPTLLELLQIEHPSNRAETRIVPMEGTSFAYSLTDAETPTRKLEQYYEMEGNRAIYSRGWKLVSWHPDEEPYLDYPWELYNLDQDPTEWMDLAASMPEKVAELEQVFAAAALRYDVLPIDDRWFNARTEFTSAEPAQISLADGAGPLNPLAEAPRLAMRSWSIKARFSRSQGDEGVLVAMGDIYSGYALFLQGGRAHFVSNLFGDETLLSSSATLPEGAMEVEVEFDHDGTLAAMLRGGLWNRYRFLGGEIRLKVDGVDVAEARLPTGPPVLIWEGLDVGLDRGSPVTHAYTPPFDFEGLLEDVTFDLR
ncbi:MAG: arylsulfatase [Deltaproteobacteria bacterium]|nr:arylsulfatase [Deltaproteobacteria bacterium]